MKSSQRLFMLSALCLLGIVVYYRFNQHKIAPRFDSPLIVSSCPLHSQAISIQFAPDSKSLIVAGSIGDGMLGRYANGEYLLNFKNQDKRLRLWNVERKQEIERLKAKPIFGEWNGYHMLLMPDFKTLVTFWGSEYIKIIDVRKRLPDKTIYVRNGYISDIDVSPDGKILALGMTSEVQFLDAQTYRLLKTYQHGGQATQVNFGPNSRIVRCTWEGMQPDFVDVQTGRRIKTPLSTRAFEVTWSANRNYFAQVTGRTSIQLWKRHGNTSHKIGTLASKLVKIQTMQFSPDEKCLAVGGLSSTEIPVEFFNVPS